MPAGDTGKSPRSGCSTQEWGQYGQQSLYSTSTWGQWPDTSMWRTSSQKTGSSNIGKRPAAQQKSGSRTPSHSYSGNLGKPSSFRVDSIRRMASSGTGKQPEQKKVGSSKPSSSNSGKGSSAKPKHSSSTGEEPPARKASGSDKPSSSNSGNSGQQGSSTKPNHTSRTGAKLPARKDGGSDTPKGGLVIGRGNQRPGSSSSARRDHHLVSHPVSLEPRGNLGTSTIREPRVDKS